MGSMKMWMLGAAVLAGAVGLGATKAEAAQFGIYVNQQSYVPPSPGPGYFWTAGYYDGGYWVPGRWAFRGDFDRGRYVAHFDRDDHRGWDRDRDRGHFDRDHDNHRGHDRR